MYGPIVTFEYNNRKYCIILRNGKFMFLKYEKHKFVLDLSDDEIDFIYKVFISLKINKNKSIAVCNKKINDRDFAIYYEYTNKIYFWYEIINGNKKKVSEEDNIKLNFMYNDLKTVIYEKNFFDWKSEERNQEQCKIKRKNCIVKKIEIAGLILEVTIIAGTNFLSFSDSRLAEKYREKTKSYIMYTEKYENLNDIFYKLNEQPYDFNIIKDTVKNNANLTDDEKNFIYNLKFYFDSNYKYMNLEEIIRRLSCLRINYIEVENSDPNICGEYDTRINQITIYNAHSYTDADIRIFMHEMLHVFQYIPEGHLISELSNELATRESIRKMDELGLIKVENENIKYSFYGGGYSQYMDIEYLFANLLTQEQMKEFQNYGDINILINALIDIDNGGKKIKKIDPHYVEYKDKAEKLLALMDVMQKEYEDCHDYKMINEINETAKYKKIIKTICEYYKKLYNKSINTSVSLIIESKSASEDDSINISDFLNIEFLKNNKLQQDNSKNILGKYFNVIHKTYFSDDHKNTIITDWNGEKIELEITPKIQQDYMCVYNGKNTIQNDSNFKKYKYKKIDNSER